MLEDKKLTLRGLCDVLVSAYDIKQHVSMQPLPLILQSKDITRKAILCRWYPYKCGTPRVLTWTVMIVPGIMIYSHVCTCETVER